MDILDALTKIDPLNDDQWTDQGLPKLKLLREITGNPDLTRKAVTEADPDFTREILLNREVDATTEVPELEPRPDRGETLKSLDEQINDLQLERDKLDREIACLTRRRRGEQEAAYSERTHKTDMQERLDYIAGQQKLRAEKAERSRRAFATGVKASDLDPRSPLDKSMTRPQGHGYGRKPRPPQPQE